MHINFDDSAELLYDGVKYRFIQLVMNKDNNCLICDCKDGVLEWIPMSIVEQSNIDVLVLPPATKSVISVLATNYSYNLEIYTRSVYNRPSRVSMLDLMIPDAPFLDELILTIPSKLFGFKVSSISSLLSTSHVFQTQVKLLEIVLNCKYCLDADWMLTNVFAERIRVIINTQLKFLSCTNLFAGNFYVRHVELINKAKESLNICFNSLLEKNEHLETFKCLGLNIPMSTTVVFGKNLKYVITDSDTIFYSWYMNIGCKTVLFLCDCTSIMDRFSSNKRGISIQRSIRFKDINESLIVSYLMRNNGSMLVPVEL